MIDSNSSEPAVQLQDGALSERQHPVKGIDAVLKNGVDSVLQTSHQLRDGVTNASEKAVHFIQEEPIKSVLIAAATGAALMALLSMASRSSVRS